MKLKSVQVHLILRMLIWCEGCSLFRLPAYLSRWCWTRPRHCHSHCRRRTASEVGCSGCSCIWTCQSGRCAGLEEKEKSQIKEEGRERRVNEKDEVLIQVSQKCFLPRATFVCCTSFFFHFTFKATATRRFHLLYCFFSMLSVIKLMHAKLMCITNTAAKLFGFPTTNLTQLNSRSISLAHPQHSTPITHFYKSPTQPHPMLSLLSCQSV